MLIYYFVKQVVSLFSLSHFSPYTLTLYLCRKQNEYHFERKRTKRNGSTKLLILFSSMKFHSFFPAHQTRRFFCCHRFDFRLAALSLPFSRCSSRVLGQFKESMRLNQQISIFVWSNWNVRGKSSTSYILIYYSIGRNHFQYNQTKHKQQKNAQWIILFRWSSNSC